MDLFHPSVQAAGLLAILVIWAGLLPGAGAASSPRSHARAVLMRSEGRSEDANHVSSDVPARPGEKASSKDLRFSLTIGGGPGCACDFRKLECLPAENCLRTFEAKSEDRIAEGIAMRVAIKEKAVFQGELNLFFPIGKGMQYTGIEAWRHWVEGNILPIGFRKGSLEADMAGHALVAWENYTACRQDNLHGASCFFNNFQAEEEIETEIGTVQKQGVSVLASQDGVAGAHTNNFQETHGKLFHSAIAHMEDFRSAAGDRNRPPEDLPADQYLMSFAHLQRILFNRRSSLKTLYKDHVAEVNPGLGSLPVALHIRRADACMHARKLDYRADASTLQEPLPGSKRVCYATSVYLDVLVRIHEKYKRPLMVYLSTDDSVSMLDQINSSHPKLFRQTTWRMLDYSRNRFLYENIIEGGQDKEKAFLSESAAADIWHLSHGQIFVGHMGSRFSKVAYLLAAARQNSPLPYSTVDGHNLCCEVDEECGKANEHMASMRDCLTFAHELSGKPINKDYWEVGSTVRWTA